MSNQSAKYYAHVDLDAFFASVEQLDHPQWKGKPVIVGGKPEDRRGVVSTASYEARAFGVHSAMPTYQAYKLCPQGIFVHGNYKRYCELSYKIMTILGDFSPQITQMSIDEAFIDLTGTEKLFGDPKETILRIKEKIKLETGLTVSIGLAPTPYLAKIASGMKKPDGFFIINEGEECNFMLKLPLEKVWGIGSKSLENLHRKGIFTTRDIYEKDLDMLEFLFGKSQGNYLYDVVRGGKNQSFGESAKSHSISNERTFPYDLQDYYLLETEILELAQEVFFRLLKEKGFSKTIFIKIRYDDFSTVSIQRTFDENILVLDDFYEKLKMLFEEKYQKGRGIRLLGVGFENIDKKEEPLQQSLFEDNRQKKQKVQKAILQLQEKHPEIKVQKARTLKLLSLSLIFLLFSSFSNKAVCQNITNNLGAASILSDSLENKNDVNQASGGENKNNSSSAQDDYLVKTEKIKFDLSGYWLLDFSTGLNFYFSPFSASFSLPLFKQEVEFNSYLEINDHYFFDVSFADAFTKNTYTVGYKNEDFLKSAVISNRNISMENSYSADYFGYGLGKSSAQSPGLAFTFADKASVWKGDLILRFDFTSSKKAEFYGLNSVTEKTIALEDFAYGKEFILPENAETYLSKIKNIYVENTKGSYKDSNHKSYVKLSASDYNISLQKGSIEFIASANTDKTDGKIPTILVTFEDQSYVSDIISLCGTYSDSSSFLGQIQQYFNKYNSKKISLSNFSYNLNIQINNEEALVIQNSSGFSPFLNAGIYDAGIVSEAEFSVINESSEQTSSLYEISELDQSYSLLEDFIEENHTYALLALQEGSRDCKSPEYRYPAAAWNPLLYLTRQKDDDTVILLKSLGELSSLNIGNNAIESSIQVYKNGVLDTGAKYNSTSGDVSLSSKIEDTDRIIIYYQEEDTSPSLASFASGAGITYSKSPVFTFDASLTSRWPLLFTKKYSTVDEASAGFTALTSGISYKNKYFEFTDKASLSVNNANGSNNLLVLCNNNYINKSYYNSQNAGYRVLSEPYVDSVYLKSENNCTVNSSSFTGQTSSEVSGYLIPLAYDFSESSLSGESLWAGLDLKLPYGELLAKASYFELALKGDLTSLNSSDYDLYLQLGVQASDTFYGEDSLNIPCWKISEESYKTLAAFDFTTPSWQTVKIALDDYDRSLLASNHDARILLIKKSSSADNISGRLYIGPNEPYVQELYTLNDENILVLNSTQITEASPSSKVLGINTNYSSLVQWKIEDYSQPDFNPLITFASSFSSADFSDYKSINLDFALQAEDASSVSYTSDQASLFLLLDCNSLNLESEGDIALKLELYNLADYISFNSEYHSLSFDIENKTLYIDGNLINKSHYSLTLNKKIIPCRIKIELNTCQNNNLYTSGSFYLNNLYYSESQSYFSARNYILAKYENNDVILKAGDFEILKNVLLRLEGQESYSSKDKANIDTTLSGQITFCNVNFYSLVNALYSSSDNDFYLNSAGHQIQSEKALFNFLNFSEIFNIEPSASSYSKSNSLKLDFNKIGTKLSFESKAIQRLYIQNQTFTISDAFSKDIKNTKITFNAKVEGNQKINSKGSDELCEDKYFDSWYKLSKLEFSCGEEKALYRSLNYNTNFKSDFTKLSFSPNLDFSLKSNINNSSLKHYLTQDLLLDFPFKVKKETFSISYQKTAYDLLNNCTSPSYLEDSSLLFSNLAKSGNFYKALPFADIFSKELGQRLLYESENQLSTYSCRYNFSWKRPLSNSIKDIFLPNNSSLIFERDIKANSTLSDLYQIKITASSTALNNFGSKSIKPVFKFFESDELYSSLTAALKLPSDNLSETSFSLSAYSQLLLYINSKSSISTALNLQLSTEGIWNVKTTFIYSRPAQKSIVLGLANLLSNNYFMGKYDITQKDIFNISMGKTSSAFFQKYNYEHNNSVKLSKHYSLGLTFGGNFYWYEGSSASFELITDLSCKVTF